MEELNLNKLLAQNENLHRKIQKYREILTLYRVALKTFARKYPEANNMNAAEKALEFGKKLESFL